MLQETTKQAMWTGDVPRLQQVAHTLQGCLRDALIVLSMFMPFVSDELFGRLFDGANIFECALRKVL
jgi:valyl-tRNA synthetase